MFYGIKIKRHNKESRFNNCDIKNICFKPGLNIIVGGNASGKSTILEIIKDFNCLDDMPRRQGYQRQNLSLASSRRNYLKEQYNVEVEGIISKVIPYNPQELKESFSFDFMMSGIFTAVESKFQSSGEGRFNYHLSFVERLQTNKNFNEAENSQIKEYNVPVDNSLIIVSDEPENSQSLIAQIGLFRWFRDFCQANPSVQVIIATHSIAIFTNEFLNNPDINYIELSKNWIKTIKKTFSL